MGDSSSCLTHAWNAGQQVRYWREEPLVVCDASGAETVRRVGLPARLWTDFLLDGPG